MRRKPRLTKSAVFAIGAAIATLTGVALIALVRLPTPFAVYFALGCVWAAAIGSLSGRIAVRRFGLMLAQVLLFFASAEVFCFGAGLWNLRVEARPTYYSRNADLGHSARPNTVAEEKEFHLKNLLYDVVYRIGPDGLRHIPKAVQGGPSKIAFFGGSFAFGHGVNDNSTMPYYFLEAARGAYQGFNFGFQGYGANQMLREIETGQMSRIMGRPDLVVYEGIADDVRRVCGKVYWEPFGPKYVFTDDGAVRYAGAFHGRAYETVTRPLRKLCLYRLAESHLGGTVHPDDVSLYVAVLSRARRQLEQRYGARLVIVFWDNTRFAKEVMRRLIEQKFALIGISGIIPDLNQNWPKYEISGFDRHPNALANRLIGQFLAHRLALQKDQAASKD